METCTNIAGYSPNGTYVIAPLTEPIIHIDSETHTVPLSTWNQLEWRSEEGQKEVAPPVGSKVRVLFYRPEGAAQFR
ncbi:MAG: hypothetical protein OHK0029_19310 [Armatimonadaceae bacterium]